MRGYKTDPLIIEKCTQLRQRGWSLGEISQALRLSKSIVSGYVRSIRLNSNQKREIRRRHSLAICNANQLRKGVSRHKNKLNKRPVWNTLLVTCVAHYLFDGSVSHWNVCYYNRSKALVERQRLLTRLLFGMEAEIKLRNNGTYCSSAYSVELANFLEQAERELLEKIATSPTVWQRSFLKAFFDDEGNVYISSQARNKRVRGYQYDFNILKTVQTLLSNFEIDSRIDNKAHCIIIRRRESVQKFAQEINFHPSLTINSQRANSLYKIDMPKRDILAILMR